ncbi:hypothetical protein TH61_12365 [Rufibacter sp. DG15C]|nr:hypothetical protein TH61_12365 [Rufibacter sp. DG15C]
MAKAFATSTQSSLSDESPKQVAASGRTAVRARQDWLISRGWRCAEEASWYSARREDGAPRPRALSGENETIQHKGTGRKNLLRNSQLRAQCVAISKSV